MGSDALKMGPLVIRADASARIGIGHIMRCFALAQAWQLEGVRVIFLSHCENDALSQRIIDAGMEFIPVVYSHPDPRDLQKTLKLLRTLSVVSIKNPMWLVLDGYHFDPVYQQTVREKGYRLLVIDDMGHLPAYHADILLNQNIGTEKLNYNCDPDTIVLLGSRYALLRQEFLAWRKWQREIPRIAHKVLVTMGGGDPDNVTLKVIHALEQLQVNGLEAVVAVGGSNPHYEMLQSAIYNLRFKIRLERNVTNMPELMAWSDVAIAAGGSTCWELAFMGLPNVVLVLAENQRAIANNLDDTGLSINLGWHEQASSVYIAQAINQLLLSPRVRSEMVRKGQDLIDGLGKSRIVKEMIGQEIVLRRGIKSDCELLWKWVNDPDVRASAFCSEHIPIAEHRQWFYGKIENPQYVQFIGLNGDNTPIGQVRFDVRDKEAEIDVSVAPNYRNNGYGVGLIRKGVQALWKEDNVITIHAFVKLVNRASLQAFLNAGFVCQGVEIIKGQSAIHLIWSRNE